MAKNRQVLKRTDRTFLDQSFLANLRSILSFQSVKQTHIYTGFLLLVGILSASILVAFSPTASTTNAKAESEMNLSEKTISYATLHSLRMCIRDNAPRQADTETSWLGVVTTPYISQTNAESGTWWNNEAKAPGSYLNSSTDSSDRGGTGYTPCNSILQTGLKLWGYKNGLELLCDAGVTRDDGGPCNGGTAKFGSLRNSVDAIYNAISKKVYNGQTPSPYMSGYGSGYPGRYLIYQAAFITGCQASPTTDFVSGRNDFNYTQTIVNDDGTTKTQNYVGGVSKSSTSRPVYVDRSINTLNKTCKEIADEMNLYAKDFALYRASHQTEDNPRVIPDSSVSETGDASSCVIEGVGWIVCPVFNFMAGVVDAAYGWVTSMLQVQPLVTTGEDATIYEAWSVMRNIANVAFVIAFLIIIFSQLTGVGISNYGIKKMLPRLVISAMLVNLSFWICAIAVDISNIVGASVVTVFNSIGADISSSLPSPEAGSEANIWGELTVIVLAAATGYYLMLSALIPALIAALIAIITVFLVLAFRHALIILLIVIAPLAFVAFLLPNTEGWFSKWRKLLFTLLLMYPIIAAIFGASALASQVVMRSAGDNTIVAIMGAAIAIVPLAITPLVMKTAGGLLNRFAGIVNNAERGPFDRLRKNGERYHQGQKDRRDTRALAGQKQLGRGSFVKWRAKRNTVYDGLKSNKGRAEQQYIADAMTDKNGEASGFAKQVAGGTVLGNSKLGETSIGQKILSTPDPTAIQRSLAGAKFTIEKAELEDIQAEKTFVSNMQAPDITKGLNDTNTSNARKAALLDRLITIGKPEDYAGYINQYGSDSSEKNAVLRSSIARSLGENGPKFLKGSNLDTIRTGTMDLSGKVQPDGTKAPVTSFEAITKANSSVYSEKNMVADTNDNIRYAYQIADQEGKKKLIDTAIKLTQNPVLKGEIKHNEDAINFLVSQSIQQPQNTTPQAQASTLVVSHDAADAHAAARDLNKQSYPVSTPKSPDPTQQPTEPKQPPQNPLGF